jgi:hypothetical protein
VHRSKIRPLMSEMGSNSVIWRCLPDVRLPPESGLKSEVVTCPRCANSGHFARLKTVGGQQIGYHSIKRAYGCLGRSLRRYGSNL